MDILNKFDTGHFLNHATVMRAQAGEWWIVEITLNDQTKYNTSFIAKRVKDHFRALKGHIYICDPTHVTALVHVGKGVNLKNMEAAVLESMPPASCVCVASATDGEGLLSVHMRMHEYETTRQKLDSGVPLLYSLRKQRVERIVMVADDDALIRTLIAETLGKNARVAEYGDTKDLVSGYLELLPDIVFMDIHMPGGSGIDAMGEILRLDETAHIVVLSSDSIKDNILSARQIGARDFLAKPFTPKRLEECYKKSLMA